MEIETKTLLDSTDFDDDIMGLSNDQQVRRAVILALLGQRRYGNGTSSIIKDSEALTDYILKGSESNPLEAKVVGRLPVLLPGRSEADPSLVHAYLKDDDTIEIQFRNPSDMGEIWDLMAEDRLLTLSFGYIPSERKDI